MSIPKIGIYALSLERVMDFRLQVIDWGDGTQILPQRYQ
jgi:hypothetical protein